MENKASKNISSTGQRLDLKSGSHLGKYRLKKCLGTGGCSEVWQARDSVEGIWVALKIPLAGLDGLRDTKALIREIRSVAQLRHRNILAVKNADIISDHAVLATELSVSTLDDCPKPMSTKKTISIIIQVLEGLAYAHRQRIVHCDVNPNNIFLFPDNRAAIGDFGIAVKLKGRRKTIDDYGTPGYVAPEQAYGYPSYSSDCFSVGLILYEYITGVLPRWPFEWPLKQNKRLQEKTSLAFVNFIKKSLAVDPEKRFADGGEMLAELMEALPKNYLKILAPKAERKETDWRKVRRQAFLNRYSRVFPVTFRCVDCDEPIDERMRICPWCGSEKNSFESKSQFSHVCPRCHKGIDPEWQYCPWCYGSRFEPKASTQSRDIRYHARCKHCNGKLVRFMRYCPWCRHKVHQRWDVRPFPEVCGKCGWSVDSNFWNYCPWCKQNLVV